MRIDGTQVALNFRGTASDVKAGSGGTARSLMPSCLEWLAERHGFKLWWGATVWFFTLLMGGARWWSGAATE